MSGWLRQLLLLPFNNSLKMQFAEVKLGLEEKSILLIDVRNPDEIRNMGRIPGSLNIPCKLYLCVRLLKPIRVLNHLSISKVLNKIFTLA